MAQVSFDQAQTMMQSYSNSGGFDFFSLVNDGDEAVVRIMHDSTDDFNIFTVHNITVGGKQRKINCIREPHESTDVCPLCKSGVSSRNVFFINMLQYYKNEAGEIEYKPVVWERSMAYASRLKSLIDEYGPLSDCMFKIKRNGAKGSMQTTYDIFYCNPKIFRDDIYQKDTEAFADQKLLGTLILDKSFDEISVFQSTGQFPQVQRNNDDQPQYTPKSNSNVDIKMDEEEVIPTRPVSNNVPDIPAGPPTRNNSSAPGRPTRYY